MSNDLDLLCTVDDETRLLVQLKCSYTEVLDTIPYADDVTRMALHLSAAQKCLEISTRLAQYLSDNQALLSNGELLKFDVAEYSMELDPDVAEAVKLIVEDLTVKGYSAVLMTILGNPWRLYIQKSCLQGSVNRRPTILQRVRQLLKFR